MAGNEVADRSSDHGMERLVTRSWGPGRNAGGLDIAVERAVISEKMLEMRHIARAPEVVHGQHETMEATPDPAACLDVLGSGFRLPVHEHEAEAGYIHPYRNHVGSQDDIERYGIEGIPAWPGEGHTQITQMCGKIPRCNPTAEFDRSPPVSPQVCGGCHWGIRPAQSTCAPEFLAVVLK